MLTSKKPLASRLRETFSVVVNKNNYAIIGADLIPAPTFLYPWEPLTFLLDVELVPYYALVAFTFGA